MHTLSAGVEHVLFPEIVHSPVPLTNGRGVFRRSLGEFVIAATLFFAKDMRRLVHNQEAGVWQQFDVEELHGRTMGIVGYGEIGRSAAALAKPFGMRVIALRRRTSLSSADPLLDAVYPPEALHQLLQESDYVVVAAPHTPETRGLIGAAEFDAMKPSAVIINVGRGPIIVESALVRALQDAGFEAPRSTSSIGSRFRPGIRSGTCKTSSSLPICADHTAGWLELAIEYVRPELPSPDEQRTV